MGRNWLRESRVRQMTAEEAAWLAGFFDGEGSLSQYNGGRSGNCKSWRLSLPNTHLESLEYCSVITNTNPPVQKIKNCKGKKDCWQWAVNRQREIFDIMQQMLPYLKIKKEKAEYYLRWFEDV